MSSYSPAFELSYAIVGMKLNVKFEDGFFDDDEKDEIISFVDAMSQEMHVDSTYVEREGSKFNSTFMIDEGWKSLNELILDSRCCMNLHPQSQQTLVEAFCTMGMCYMFECLSLKYDVEHISVEVDQTQDFEVIFIKDTSKSWMRYPGKWQTWQEEKHKSQNASKKRTKKDNESN